MISTEAGPSEQLSYFKAMRRSATIRRSIKVSAVVGTVLILINHWDKITAMTAPPAWQVALTYAVPFLVSAHSEAMASRKTGGHAAAAK